MKLTTALSALALTALAGCSVLSKKQSTPIEINKPTPQTKPALDERCSALARLTREIATIRDIGIDAADVPLVVQHPNDYPLDIIVREVYANKGISPADGASNSYGTCVRVSYETITAALIKAQEEYALQEAQRAKDALAAKKAPKAKKVKK